MHLAEPDIQRITLTRTLHFDRNIKLGNICAAIICSLSTSSVPPDIASNLLSDYLGYFVAQFPNF